LQVLLQSLLKTPHLAGSLALFITLRSSQLLEQMASHVVLPLGFKFTSVNLVSKMKDLSSSSNWAILEGPAKELMLSTKSLSLVNSHLQGKAIF